MAGGCPSHCRLRRRPPLPHNQSAVVFDFTAPISKPLRQSNAERMTAGGAPKCPER